MMQHEVKLYNNPKEREMYENMADLYSIIKTTEALERAHMRDAINYEEYPPSPCSLCLCSDVRLVGRAEGTAARVPS